LFHDTDKGENESSQRQATWSLYTGKKGSPYPKASQLTTILISMTTSR